jgi:hypothetical protein
MLRHHQLKLFASLSLLLSVTLAGDCGNLFLPCLLEPPADISSLIYYGVHNTLVNFTGAMDFCASQNGSLAIIRDNVTFTLLYGMLKATFTSATRQAFIGFFQNSTAIELVLVGWNSNIWHLMDVG